MIMRLKLKTSVCFWQANKIIKFHIITACYFQHLNTNRYTGPEACAKAASRYFPEDNRSCARVLDVAAGTGRLGAEVQFQSSI